MLGARIAARRKELNMSQGELARRMGYKSRSTINKIELGINDITQSKIAKFAAVLDTTPAYLMGWEDVTEEQKKDNDIIASVVARMRSEKEFFEFVKTVYSYDAEKINGLSGVLRALTQNL